MFGQFLYLLEKKCWTSVFTYIKHDIILIKISVGRNYIYALQGSR